MTTLLTIIILLVLGYNLSSNFKEFVDYTFSGIKSWFGVKKKKEEPYNRYSKYSKQETPREEPYTKYTRQTPTSLILEALMEMGNDFKDNQYSDKLDVTNPNNFFVYYFENGSKLYISSTNRLTYEKVNYDIITSKCVQISMSETYQFLDIITHFSKCASSRGYKKFNQSYSQGYGQSKPNSNYTPEQIKYQELFRKLKDINDRRMEQLAKMSETDPDRPALVNEVNVVKRKMKDAFEKSGLILEKSR